MLFTGKNFVFSDFMQKKNFASENVGRLALHPPVSTALICYFKFLYQSCLTFTKNDQEVQYCGNFNVTWNKFSKFYVVIFQGRYSDGYSHYVPKMKPGQSKPSL